MMGFAALYPSYRSKATSVIASEAKQSIFPDTRRDGLLRRFSAKLLCNFVASSSQ
ncbi:hypothetical protein ACVIHI_002885 [Bradyrhizobium sp. USDA 4524]|nr:hypothetical protein [Bradyrhizobium sp. USDA 4538]MCP1904761.1 hypothetical protein [Bradyrhizobium sp. USDA 4537]MCP1989583.1 hypothetical protein [Bradyrhizobium sp. USDA 4539]